MSLVVGLAAVLLLGVLVFLTQEVGDRIAHGPGGRPVPTDPIAEAQYDRKRGDVSGLGGM